MVIPLSFENLLSLTLRQWFSKQLRLLLNLTEIVLKLFQPHVFLKLLEIILLLVLIFLYLLVMLLCLLGAHSTFLLRPLAITPL